MTSKRGLLVRPGRHEAIISDEEYRDAVAGVASRKHHTDRSPRTSRRVYSLRGLMYCECGSRMRGDTRVARGHEWAYYACPVADGRSALRAPDGSLVECHAGRVRAAETEQEVVAALSAFAVPEETVAAAREELRQRLRAPAPGTADRERERLRARRLGYGAPGRS